jgi:hypothetical protein
MLGRLGDPRWRRLAVIGVTLHLIFLMTAQLEHHDLLCHVKTPFHCTSCASSQISSDPHTPAVVGSWHLADVGRAIAFALKGESALLAVHTPGRSPPALA